MKSTEPLPDHQESEAKTRLVLLRELAEDLADLPVLSEEALARSSIYDDRS